VLRAILFDLDDTLYRERDFVASGFDAVAANASRALGIESQRVRDALERALATHGRGHTIDHALESLGMEPARVAQALPSLVHAYRSHRPRLHLLPDAARCLDALERAGIAMGLVTDGDPSVQRSKVDALGLHGRFVVERYTWDAGAALQKPHASAFEPALEVLARLGLHANETLYVGDNPTKDFVGARALGLRTMRVRRGPYAETTVPERFEADEVVDTLDVVSRRVQGAGRLAASEASACATRTAP
jgi:putative hydrolase of the HAD superfamily